MFARIEVDNMVLVRQERVDAQPPKQENAEPTHTNKVTAPAQDLAFQHATPAAATANWT